MKIRQYHPSDLVSLYKICLLTANSGSDATKQFSDPDMIGHLYAAPYAIYEPDLAFVVSKNGKPCGYIIGAKNSQHFFEKCEREWFPILRKRYPLRDENDKSFDARIIKRIHLGHIVKEELKNYSAHLHINLLPETQGLGLGREIMDVFINKLKELKIPSLYLEVGKSNTGAIKFYKKMGFEIIKEYEYSIAFGMKYLNNETI